MQARASLTPTEWLLKSDELAIAFLTRRDVLGERVEPDPEAILAGPIVRGLLDGQRPDGGFGSHPYKKWTGAHWRLVSLVELGVPAGPPALAAAETVLDWLTGKGHRRAIEVVDGLVRRCASQEGNALAVCCRLGMADDPRVELLARSLEEWQWPDGGWNCDRDPKAATSSFSETLLPLRALALHARLTGSPTSRAACVRAAEVFLQRRLSARPAPGHSGNH